MRVQYPALRVPATRPVALQKASVGAARIGLLHSLVLCGLCSVDAWSASSTATVLQTIKAREAHQGVAVDRDHIYAIGTKVIGKYDRKTGKKTGGWRASAGDGIIHLDSGVVVDGKLYAGHSNYPRLPMDSSIEVWDVDTLKRVDSIPLGEAHGSCTWIDRHDDAWWVCYAHYERAGGYKEKGPEFTTLAKYDDEFRELGTWVFPDEVIDRFSPNSCSGGSWGPDGLLYCSGHDRAELYAMRVPDNKSVLELVDTIKVESRGQGIAWDRSRENTICTIKRGAKKVVISRISTSSGGLRTGLPGTR